MTRVTHDPPPLASRSTESLPDGGLVGAFLAAASDLIAGSAPASEPKASAGSLVAGQAGAGQADPFNPEFKTSLPAGYKNRPIQSDNDVPLNTVVMSGGYDDAPGAPFSEKEALMKANIKANPDVVIAYAAPKSLIGVLKADPEKYGITTKSDDPSAILADLFNVPEKNIRFIEAKGNTWDWAQDPFRSGGGGLMEPPGGYGRGMEIADAVSDALNIGNKDSQFASSGGDCHFLTRPDGSQAMIFGPETIEANRTTSTFRHRPPDSPWARFPNHTLSGIVNTMERAKAEGADPKGMLPLSGSDSGKTYGDVLAALTPEERKSIDKDVLARLESLKGAPFPDGEAPSYHLDLYFRSPDGVNAFVPGPSPGDGPELKQMQATIRKTLEADGYKVHEFPTGTRPGATPGGEESLSYTNWQMGVGADGRQAILMPTEAKDPEKLTPNDKKAMETIKNAVPGINVIPIGGETAWTPGGEGGPHCLSNPLPWTIEGPGPDTVPGKAQGGNRVSSLPEAGKALLDHLLGTA